MDIQSNDWIMHEFRHFEIGDARLIERFFLTAQLLSARPLDCIHKACQNWSTVKGAYRLFGNDKLHVEDIFSCHQHETLARAKDHQLVFAIQDTCYLDYDAHPKTKGLGSISRGYGKDKLGLIVHPTYLVTEQALPLGLLTWNCWARALKPTRTQYQKLMENYHRHSIDKESYKWTDALKQCHELLPTTTKVVTLADREADIFELIHEHNQLGQSYVIRNRVNRRIGRTKYKSDPKLHDVLAKKEPCGSITIDLPARHGRKARTATLVIRFGEFSTPIRSNLKGGISMNREGMPSTISFQIIHALEINPPDSEEPIDWHLTTNEPIQNLEQAIEKVNWYKLRWQIETFFRVLKSGCKIEDTRLGEASRLQKYNALMAVIAWRISYLTHVSRTDPKSSCTNVMDADHWQALYCRVHQTSSTPKQAPNIEQVTLWLAQLGGFLNRKSDGFPGPTALWRGWQILEEVLPLYLAMKTHPPP